MKAVSAEGLGLRSHAWRRFLRGPDEQLVEALYVPGLKQAVRYDRCCAYFSSSVLAAAARGFAGLIERLVAMGEKAPRPAVRLIVNEELVEEDVRALVERGDAQPLTALLAKRLKSPKEALEKQRLAMLGWLVKQGLLEVRVGVMRRGEGIVHAKFGIMTDVPGDSIVFSGSGNESAHGLRANYEEIEVTASWEDSDRHAYYRGRFDSLWSDADSEVHTVSLPEAIRLKLVRFASREPITIEPSTAAARQRAAMLWQFIAEAPYLPNGETACDATAMVTLWPHQARVVDEASAAWPDGRLLCDEVGMGKTVEAILVLRRLLAGRGVTRVTILVPAGLLVQWQTELREKGGLIFPRLEGVNTLIWPNGRIERTAGLASALEQDYLLMSRETARTENNRASMLLARPWDLIILDEAHAARREKQVETEYNKATLLLGLLRDLQLRRRARGLLLLSATPMQTQPWEPWDLLATLGEGGRWLADFEEVRRFYRVARSVPAGRADLATARSVAQTILSDPIFPPLPTDAVKDAEELARRIVFAPQAKRTEVATWMRRGSPLARRMHRNTRLTLRRYWELGLLDRPPPRREVEDRVFDFEDAAERRIYDDVTAYIERRFHELEEEKPGKGFVMTIYRRRAASSYASLKESLKRREQGLQLVTAGRAHDDYFEEEPGELEDEEIGDVDVRGRISAALPSDPEAARRELQDVRRQLENLAALGSRDRKRDFFFDLLRRVTDDGRSVLVFTEYTDTLDYLKEALVGHYGAALGCYSGRGGECWEGGAWQTVSKTEIITGLHSSKVKVLICTDAASEGLNLQAAAALINYDLPWNPSKVEQRIGRIDRIGQKREAVRIVNLFLKNSVDEQVYRVLRERCGLFEHFVGPMQPVLARARRILTGQAGERPEDLVRAAAEVEPLAEEAYIESEAVAAQPAKTALTRRQVVEAIGLLGTNAGVEVKPMGDELFRVAGFDSIFALSQRQLERDQSTEPLTPLSPQVREIASRLNRPGERLPLVLASSQSGSIRVTIANWVDETGAAAIESFSDLTSKLASWNGRYPDPAQWLSIEQTARAEAESIVQARIAVAQQRESAGMARQVEAAELRLQREVGRYLVCLGANSSSLNDTWHQYLSRRDAAGVERLHHAFRRFGNWPEWSDSIRVELDEFGRGLQDAQRRARLAGKEIDAALSDPRWSALDSGTNRTSQ